ncbi:MAG: glycosyltransferase family 4 protein [Bacteroidales bacterium]|nr:glycosyltransferase family 4 protein [Bacteroidales bacterium]
MNKPRLVYFGIKYFPSRGGVSRTTENLIRNLKDEFDITIYCYRHPNAKNNVPGVNVIQFPELPFGGLGVYIYFWICFFHIMLFGKYDIVHLRKIDAAFFLPLLRLKFKRILATSHESPYVRDKWSFIGKTYFRFNERLFIKSKAKLTVISKPLSDYYKEKYNRDVEYVPNGIEIVRDYDEKTASDILKKNKVEEEYLFFGARRIMSTKGCHTMINSLNILNYKNPVLIAGDIHSQQYIDKLKENAKNLDIKFLGYLSNKPALLALAKKAEFFIFPSETEGMSIMLLEVAGTQTPIICSDIPENTEVFDDNDVLFFKNKDADDLAEKLEWATANKGEMKRRSLSAFNKVTTIYSGDSMTDNYRRLYKNLLNDQIN